MDDSSGPKSKARNLRPSRLGEGSDESREEQVNTQLPNNPYAARRNETHEIQTILETALEQLKSCQQRLRQSGDSEAFHLSVSSLISDKLQGSPSVDLLELKFTQKLDAVNTIKFAWIPSWYREYTQASEQWEEMRDNWDAELNATITALTDMGFVDEAGQLAQRLLSHPRVAHRNRFQHEYITPGGLETIVITGKDRADEDTPVQAALQAQEGCMDSDVKSVDCDNTDPDSEDDSDSTTTSGNASRPEDEMEYLPPAPRAAPAISAQEFFRFSALAEPVSVDDKVAAVMTKRKGLGPLDTVPQHVYISQVSGTCGMAFCIDCGCPRAVVPTPSADLLQQAYDLVPRFIPIENIITHYQEIHRAKISLKDILLRYAVTVQANPIDKLRIAGHNEFIRMRYKYSALKWERLLQHSGLCMSSEPALDIVTGIDRTIPAQSLPRDTCIFHWPPDNTSCRLVVYCTDPDCLFNSFTEHPLVELRAIHHFQSHGLDLKDSNAVLQLFGFKVTRKEAPRPVASEAAKPNNHAQSKELHKEIVVATPQESTLQVAPSNNPCIECRTKHRKCDQLVPCTLCRQNETECSYDYSGVTEVERDVVVSVWDRRLVKVYGGQIDYLVSFKSNPRKKKWVNSRELGHAKKKLDEYNRRYPIVQTRLRSGGTKHGRRGRRANTIT